MGNVQSSKIKNMVELVNGFTTNINNSNATTNTGFVTNRQSYDIEVGVGGVIECRSINAGQTINSNQNLITSSTFNSAQQVKNELQNMIDQIASSGQKAVAEFLSLSANAQVSEQELTTSIKNSIENNITTSNITTCQAITNNLQEGRLVVNGILKCTEGDLNLAQNIIANQEAQCLSEVFFNAIADNSIINDIKQKAESTQDAKTIGPIGAFFGSVGGIITVVIILILLGVAGFVAFKIFKSQGGGSALGGNPSADPSGFAM
jgi:hypothetical protein